MHQISLLEWQEPPLFALSNIFSFFFKIAFCGVKNTIIQNDNISQGVYVINGNLTNKAIGDWYNLPQTLK